MVWSHHRDDDGSCLSGHGHRMARPILCHSGGETLQSGCHTHVPSAHGILQDDLPYSCVLSYLFSCFGLGDGDRVVTMAFLGSWRAGVCRGMRSMMRLSYPPLPRAITPKMQQLRTTVNFDDLAGTMVRGAGTAQTCGWGGGPLRLPSSDACPGLEACPPRHLAGD